MQGLEQIDGESRDVMTPSLKLFLETSVLTTIMNWQNFFRWLELPTKVILISPYLLSL